MTSPIDALPSKGEGKPAFTPGPWRYYSVKLRGGLFHCVEVPGAEGIDLSDDHNGGANARLIAAAPNMVAALTEAERFFSYYAGETDNVFVGVGTPKTCLATVRAALSLARGGEAG